nr:hypothetical protein [Variovorax boronicumulans]
MRKISSLAICVFALSGAATVFAAQDAGTPPLTVRVDQQLQAWVHQAQFTATQFVGDALRFDAGASNRGRAASASPTAQGDEQTGNAMLLAGLLVMGVIIKRRSGQRD